VLLRRSQLDEDLVRLSAVLCSAARFVLVAL
jgi:hypothetical protein